MPTECNPDLFGFAPVGRHEVVGSFDGGSITSDAGALLLRQTDRVIGLTKRECCGVPHPGANTSTKVDHARAGPRRLLPSIRKSSENHDSRVAWMSKPDGNTTLRSLSSRASVRKEQIKDAEVVDIAPAYSHRFEKWPPVVKGRIENDAASAGPSGRNTLRWPRASCAIFVR